MDNEMFAADVRNWFADLAIGAKATLKTIQWGDNPWEYSRTFNNATRDGVPTVNVHNLEELAERAGFELLHRDFVVGDYYYTCFRSENFVMFNGVKFADYENLTEAEREARRAEEDAQREREEEDND